MALFGSSLTLFGSLMAPFNGKNWTSSIPTRRSGLPPAMREAAALPASARPLLLIIVDTEEEFDWSAFSRTACGVTSIQAQIRAQRIFDKYKVKPTYAIDYPVASQEEGYGILREFVHEGRANIGAHLHPWVNPPFEEEVTVRNSYPCNLPADLELRKLSVLTQTIIENFGIEPILYKAGRYGMDHDTVSALETLGYRIDCSVLPWTDLMPFDGPNFCRCSSNLYWAGETSNLLEIPLTTGLSGSLWRVGRELYQWLDSPQARRLRVTGALARTGLLERVRLTPEGTTLDEAIRISRVLFHRRRQRVFTVTYHSPSLEPGHTSYVRDEKDLSRFLAWIEGYLEFFFGELGGIASTPSEVYQAALINRQGGDRRPAQAGV